MLRVWKSVRVGVLALTACTVAGEAAAGLAGPSDHKRFGRSLESRPMIFFVAKGPANSCGPGCNEWIAAVGNIDSGAADRFLELAGKLNGRKLPVFFHSPGGISGAGMKIGYALRERRMASGVGRTETKCRLFDKKDKDCQDKINAGEAIPAKLVSDDAACMSSCVYAFAGASSRRVAPPAALGVHSAKFNGDLTKLRTIPLNASRKRQLEILSENANPKPNSEELAHYRQVERHYYVTMGINPDLSDFSLKTPHKKIYLLDRSEIARFALETQNDKSETSWVNYKIGGKKALVTKSITRLASSEPTQNLTTQFFLHCPENRGHFIDYRRELAIGADQGLALVGIAFDDLFLEFRVTGTRDNMETGIFSSLPLSDEMITKFSAAKTLSVWERKKATEEIVETKFSNAGLGQALGEFRKGCAPEYPPGVPPFNPNIVFPKKRSS